MNDKKLFKELFFILDTCHAASLFDSITTPNLWLVATSLREENAYSHHFDVELNQPLNDKFTYFFWEYLNGP